MSNPTSTDPTFIMQPTFDGGEIDPHLWSRLDLKKYATGMRTCRNFFIHKFGAASNRPGTKFIYPAKFNNSRCRLIPFTFSNQQVYILEFGVGYIRFFVNDGLITSDGTNPYEVITPYSESDLRGLDIAQSADTLFIACYGKPQQVLTRYAANNWTFLPYAFHGGPFMPANVDITSTITPSAKTGSTVLTSTKAIFQAGHVGALWRLDQDVSGQTTSQAFSGVGTTAVFGCGSTWRLVTHGTWTGTVVIERSYDNGVTWMQVRAFTATSDMNYNQYGTEDQVCQIRARVTTLSSGPITIDLSIDPYVGQGIVQITAFTDNQHVTGTVLQTLGGTTATDNWFEGAWSTVRGYPAAVCFWEDRLVWGGTQGAPNGESMSQTADYTNFATSSPTVKDDDAIAINIISRKLNGIKYLAVLRATMICLTSEGEFSISFANQSLTPSSVASKNEGNRGSANVKPIIIGNRIVLVQQMGGVVRDLGYDFYSDSYTGDDLSVYSAHLVTQSPIVEMAYQQEPDSIVWFVRNDGVLLSMTYLKEQQVLAWARHDTQGIFESVCTIPGDGYNEVWLAVNRTVNGQTVRYIEKMVQRMPTTNPADQWFVDAGLQYNGLPATTMTGLSHLNGLLVKIVGDGNVYPDQVVSNGTITISPAASKITVGLGYNCDLETLNVEIPGVTRGTNQGQKVQIGTLILRLLNSRGGMVGQDEDNLFEWQERSYEPMGKPLQLFSGDAKINGGFEYEEGGRLFFRQSDPMPVTILAFIPGLTYGGI